MEYFAITHPADPNVVENVFIVNRAPDVLDLAVFEHRHRRWISLPYLVTYLFGDEQSNCQQITEVAASEFLAAWGATLPTDAELLELRESDADI